MELNRNQFFLIGLVILLIGVQAHYVHSIELTPNTVKLLANKTGHPMSAAINATDDMTGSETSVAPSKTLVVPEAFGWSFMSIGAVLVLHAFAMQKP